jgi:hypothetical protein
MRKMAYEKLLLRSSLLPDEPQLSVVKIRAFREFDIDFLRKLNISRNKTQQYSLNLSHCMLSLGTSVTKSIVIFLFSVFCLPEK